MDTMVAHGVPNKLRALKLGINLLKPPSQSVSQSGAEKEMKIRQGVRSELVSRRNS